MNKLPFLLLVTRPALSPDSDYEGRYHTKLASGRWPIPKHRVYRREMTVMTQSTVWHVDCERR